MEIIDIARHTSGIYMICNLSSPDCKKVYIGSSIDLRGRSQDHRSELIRGIHKNDKLQKGFNKYGADLFHIEVLELCEEWELEHRENHYFKIYDDGERGCPYYNLAPLSGTTRGIKRTPEQRAAQSIREKQKPMTEARLEAIRKARAAQVCTPEHAANIAKALTGKKHTDESRAKMSAKQKGKKLSPEAKANVVQAVIDRPRENIIMTDFISGLSIQCQSLADANRVSSFSRSHLARACKTQKIYKNLICLYRTDIIDNNIALKPYAKVL